jgi:dihydrofolate reductase
MAKLIFHVSMSLDGYIEDPTGSFDFGAPTDEVHFFVNKLQDGIGTYLFGRRNYETMAVWDNMDAFPDPSPATLEYADIWRGIDKVVYSTTLASVSTARTRLEPTFDPAAVARMKAESPHDLGIGGPTLAAHAFAAGLVDEVSLFVVPVALGGGKPALTVPVALDLLDERRFENGTVYVRYATRL